MKEKHIKLVGGFRHKIDKGGRLTSHHAKLLLGIAETWGAENVSLGNRLVMATSAANVAAEELSKSRKACDALRSESANALDQAAGELEKAKRKQEGAADRSGAGQQKSVH